TIQEGNVEVSQLRNYLRERLPDYMIPAAFVLMEQLPLTLNGKVDRHKLPIPDYRNNHTEQSFITPRNPIEEIIATIWQRVLGITPLSVIDNFFELGGHSLLATQVISQIRNVFKVEIALRVLFENPTIAGLASAVAVAQRTRLGLVIPPIELVNRDVELPLSFAQQRLWFIDQLQPNSCHYHIPGAFRIIGKLDVTALQESLNEVVRRHEVLRTNFGVVDGRAVQLISQSLTIIVPVIDLSEMVEDKQTTVHRLVNKEMQRPFNLRQGPLLRVSLLKLDQQEYLILLIMHHIISDGWSIGVLIRELTVLYQAYHNGEKSPLKELSIQYADFAVWQRQRLQGEVLDEQLSYWQKQLSDKPTVLALPTDRPRPSTQAYRGSRKTLVLSEELSKSLKVLSHKQEVTLFMVLLAGYQALLYRYSNQESISVGTPIANRNRAEIEGLIGFFVNTLVLHSEVKADESFVELLERVRESCLAAYAHQDIPFEKLVEELQPARDMSHSPLFQVMFILQNTPVFKIELTNLSLTPVEFDNQTAKFDLTLSMIETEAELFGVLEYNTDLFDASTIERMIGHYENLLQSIVLNPQQSILALALLSEAERHQLLYQWNNTYVQYPTGRCIHELFEEQVERSPESVAVVFEDQILSYRELNNRANQLAHYLRTMGVGPDQLVGICMERSIEMVIGLIGILKSGGAYLPLDPDYPLDRLAFMVVDSSVKILLTQQRLQQRLSIPIVEYVCLDTDWTQINLHSYENLAKESSQDNLAYVTYTSGSTGMPKGVEVLHRGVVRLVCNVDYVKLDSQQTTLQLAPLAFDASTFELWGALLNGAKCVLYPERYITPQQLSEIITSQQVRTMWLTSSLYNLIVDEQAEALSGLEQLLIGGEALSLSHVQKGLLQLPNVQLINGYGPTEATTFTCCYRIVSNEEWCSSIPIGRPINNTEVYLLDENMQPVPIGVVGELYIGGDGLARGYLHQAELSAEKFVPHPYSKQAGARLYRSGDWGRYRADGSIEFIGRIDNQIKLRGFRIELAEIEAKLNEHRQVRECVVVASEGSSIEKRLIAYLVTEAGENISTAQLQHYLQDKLPEYMLPSAYVQIERLPLTANGKVDRRALPAPDCSRTDIEQTITAPRNPLEEVIAAIWTRVLAIARVSIDDNFFELGGHSLLATQVILQVRSTFKVEVSLRALFENPTIKGLAEEVAAARRNGQGLIVPRIEAVDRNGELPLSFAQQRLWFIDQLEPGNVIYNIPIVLRIEGQLNIVALAQSINEIIKRHEILRTYFIAIDGRGTQLITDNLILSLPVIDLQQLPTGIQETCLQQLALAEGQQPFNLSQCPLLRIKLLKLSEQVAVLLMSIHHIISDGYSIGVLVHEMTLLYKAYCNGMPSPLSPLTLQYADFAYWQRQWLQGEVLERQLDYWKHQLEGAPAALELPTDRPRPHIQTYLGAKTTFHLSKPLLDNLKRLSWQESVTLFMTLLAVFKILLYRYSNQQSIVVGIPIACRNHTDTEKLIGLFVNTLALCTNLTDKLSFKLLLASIRETALLAYDHQDLPFERLVEKLQVERSLSHTPIFQVMFTLQDGLIPLIEIEDITINQITIDYQTTKFDLSLSMMETEHGLVGGLEYNTALFDTTTIARMLNHFQSLFEAVVIDPTQYISHLSMLTEAERYQLLFEWNDTQSSYAQDKCFHELFETQVVDTPDAIAVIFADQQLSYSELNTRANQLAYYLIQLGVRPEILVGVYLKRSLDMMIALLGILKAGGAYLPLDTTYPKERLAAMIADGQPLAILTREDLISYLPQHNAKTICLDIYSQTIVRQSIVNPHNLAQSSNLAYVIYTSGSTGKPKGVMIHHNGLVNYLNWCRHAYRVTAGQAVAVHSSIGFDLTITSLFAPLLQGATVVLAADGQGDEELAELLKERGDFALVKLTPSHLDLLSQYLSEQKVKIRIGCLIIGGEVLLGEKLAWWCTQMSQTRLINEYGPTESVVGCAVYEAISDMIANGPIPIGRPIINTKLYILDKYLQPLPIGVSGELYISG
ncbi:MAG: amino acid adenylation domain-containing protein, partial [Acidobacteriota bacterium]